MNVKIDTKEKFSVIAPIEAQMTAIMTEELNHLLLDYRTKAIPHVVLNMKNVASIDEQSGEILANVQQNFYEHDCSLVICALQPAVENLLDQLDLLAVMNITPTESEAWDIVQMEEMERELFNDEP